MADDGKIVVLVADDEPSTLALLSRHLRGKSYSVLEASDGDQAWELAHQHLPHLVLLDVMMPGMSGWEVCRKIREAVSLAHTGVVMLTGIGENLNEMTSPLYGADAHVDKPFEFGDLDDAIEETLERRRDGAIGRADGEDEDEETTIERPTLPAAGSRKKAKRAAAEEEGESLAEAPEAPKPPVKAKPSGSKRSAKAEAPASE